MDKNQLKTKYVESILVARLDEGSNPSGSTKNKNTEQIDCIENAKLAWVFLINERCPLLMQWVFLFPALLLKGSPKVLPRTFLLRLWNSKANTPPGSSLKNVYQTFFIRSALSGSTFISNKRPIYSTYNRAFFIWADIGPTFIIFFRLLQFHYSNYSLVL